MELDKLLKVVIEKHASDLHLDVGSPPVFRINGVLLPQEEIPPFTRQDIQTMLERVTTLEQREEFQKEMELDFAYSFFGNYLPKTFCCFNIAFIFHLRKRFL